MQEVKLNYHNGALRSTCFELCTENCIGGPTDRISWESPSFMVETFICSQGSGGAGCSVGCNQLSSSVLKQSLCSISAIQECLLGHRGHKGGNRRVLPEQSSVLLSEHMPNQVVFITYKLLTALK